MAVLHSGVEVYAFAAQLLAEEADEFVGLGRGNVPGGVVFNLSFFDADEVAAHGQLAGREVDAHAGCLKHAAALVDGGEIVAEDGHIRYFAAGMEAGGYGDEPAAAAFPGQQVHPRGMGRLQEGAAAE